jgi:hypothetical protein
VHLEQDRPTCLFVIGVRPDGSNEVIALEAGYSESEEVWASLS